MITELIPDEIQFAENAEPRCPCVLVLDVSSSMSGAPIAELNRGIATFAQELKNDPLASLRVEVAIITFGQHAFRGLTLEQDFVTVDIFSPSKVTVGPGWTMKELTAWLGSGSADMDEGVNLALDKIEERKKSYNANGIDYYRPWLLLMTDGFATCDRDELMKMSRKLKDAHDQKKVAAFCVGVLDADMDTLAEISPTRPLKLKGLDFSSLFVWLSQSMSRVSASRTGEQVELDVEGLKEWAAI